MYVDLIALVANVICYFTILTLNKYILSYLKVVDPSLSDRYTDDMSSEVADFSRSGQFCDYSLQVKPAAIVKVQLMSKMFKGLLSPQLQLLEVSPTLDICVEHRSNPALCFANSTTLQVRSLHTLTRSVGGYNIWRI